MRLFGAAVLGSVSLSCGGSDPTGAPPPQLGSIVVSIVTTGHDLDADGYLVTIDQQPPRAIAVNDSFTVNSLTDGSHSVVESGNSENCRTDTARVTPVVASGAPARVTFHIHCVRTQLHNEIVYSTDSLHAGDLIAMNPDGSEPELITFDQQVDYFQPSVSPDERQIAFTSFSNGSTQIGIVKVDGAERRTLPTPGHFDGEPVWSPDGSAVAFRSERSGPFGDYGRIFIINSDGSGLRQLSPEVGATDYAFDDSPSWSSDGSKILFSRSGAAYTINTDGTGLASLGFDCEYPAWSPDASRIACTATVSGNMDVYLESANGTSSVRLTTYADQDQAARWSPDGTQLVFIRVINSKFQLVRINSDGTGETQLTQTSGNETDAWWAW